MLLTMCISIYTSRVVLQVLGEVNYGIYNVVGGFVSMFTVISGAMSTASQRFLSFEIGKGSSGKVHEVFSTAIIIHIGLGLIILLLGETVGIWFINNYLNLPHERYYAANWVFQFSLLTFIISVISVPYNAVLIAYERMKAFAYVSIFEVTLKLLIVYFIAIAPFDKLIFYSILMASTSLILSIVYGVYVNRNLKQCHFNWVWDKSKGMEMGSFVSWNLIGSLAGVLKEQGINVVLNMFFGAAINAARGVAYQVLNAVGGFVNNFQVAMNPQIVKHYSAGEKYEMFRLVFRGSKFSFLIMLMFVLPLTLEAPYILNIWLVNVPAYTGIFLRLVLLTSLVDSLSGTLITSMHASGKVKDYQIVVGGLSLLTLPLVYVALKLGAPPYAAMFIGLCMAVALHVARILMLKASIHFPVMDYFRKITLRVFFLALLSAVVPTALYFFLSVNFINFLVVCLVSVISVITISYRLGLSMYERQKVKEKVASIVNKFIHK
ncbi:MATE family efflux transporter [Segatella bryantii]|uniref:Lipopolysaccharide biosynthesis protein n=1 Tax=Segatella bryantii TaxID=77095 RepID=A0ABX4EKJ7_SEGBR|nr:MATE family efflux transporter [Segatella bryantii]OYP57196.1 hypothetical protein CIK91_00815 [Segatella bryantii]